MNPAFPGKMSDLLEIVRSFVAGATLGAIFVALRLPIPAPPNLAGVVGIIGVFVGFVVMSHFFGKYLRSS